MEKENLAELKEIVKDELKEILKKSPTISEDYARSHKALKTIEQLEKALNDAEAKLEKARKITIDVNNGDTIDVELKDNRLIFTKKDAKGNVKRADAVLDGEIVLLYDYILYQRENDLELF